MFTDTKRYKEIANLQSFCNFCILHFASSSKEMGFYNPRSHLDSTDMTYCPHAAKNGEDR